MFEHIVNRLEEGAIAFLLGAMTLLAFLQVVLRFVFNTGLSWSLEATTYLFAWLVLVGISYGVKTGAHIGVDALVNLLPRRGRQVAGAVAGLLSCLYAVLLTYGSWEYFKTVHLIGVTGEDILVKRWILIIILPIGFALLLARLVEATWRVMRGEELGFRLADEAADAMKLQQMTDASSASEDRTGSKADRP